MERSVFGKRIGVVADYARLHANLMRVEHGSRDINRDSVAYVFQDIAAWLERLARDAEHCGDCPLKAQGGSGYDGV